MEFALALLQGIGIAAAIGVRPMLPVLLTGALASQDVGVDFDGTDFAFLEAWPFLLAAVLVTAGFVYVGRIRPAQPVALLWVLAATCVILGALEAAGSLSDVDYTIVPGVVLGAAAAALGFAAARDLYVRVRRRLDAEAAGALPVYFEGVALAGAGLSILFPPLALLMVGGLAWLLMGGRRREGEKYAGLRILR